MRILDQTACHKQIAALLLVVNIGQPNILSTPTSIAVTMF
jgi:hypothetical protein